MASTNPITDGLTSIWGGIETWAEGTEAALATFLTGLASSFTLAQFTILGKAATVYKAKLTATPPASQAAAFTAALNELSADEIGELDTLEIDALNFIIQISGTAPATPAS